MAEAASLSNPASVRAAFFFSSTIGRILIGPSTDLARDFVTLEMWIFSTCVATTASFTLLYIFGLDFAFHIPLFGVSADLLFLAAILCGWAFGAISTLVPLMCRRISPAVGGTLYATSKVGCMIMSSIWIRHAAGRLSDASKTKWSPNVYDETLRFVVLVCVPLTLFTVVWACRCRKIDHDAAVLLLEKARLAPSGAGTGSKGERKKKVA